MDVQAMGAEVGGPGPCAVIRSSSGAEVWVGCPEGLARACLEHKRRPSLRARAVLATPCEGLGSLLLRMEADGLGSLTAVGPCGLERFVDAIAPIVRVASPRVHLVECCSTCSDRSIPPLDSSELALHPILPNGFSTASTFSPTAHPCGRDSESAWHAAKHARVDTTGTAPGEGSVPSLEGFKGGAKGARNSQFPRRLSRLCSCYGEGQNRCSHRGLQPHERPSAYIVDCKEDSSRIGVLCSDCPERETSPLIETLSSCHLVLCLFDTKKLSQSCTTYVLLQTIQQKHNVQLLCPLGPLESCTRANARILARLNSVSERNFPIPPLQRETHASKGGSVVSCPLVPRMRFKQRVRRREQPECSNSWIFDDSECPEDEEWKNFNTNAAEAYKRESCSAIGTINGGADNAGAELHRKHQLHFIGTGSAEPTKYRGPSAIMLQVVGSRVLLEAGENTVGALEFLRGKELATNDLYELSCILISHSHADHILGLPSIVRKWQALHAGDDNKLADDQHRYMLTVVGPSSAEKLLDAFGLLDGGNVHFNRWAFGQEQVLNRCVSVHSVQVKHIPEAAGFWIGCREDGGAASEGAVSVGFSGDCRPSTELMQLFRTRTTDVVVHEATFEDNMQQHATKKKHCTVSEALSIAAGARPRHGVVLTHFSQRYPGVPHMPRDMPVIPAFDGLTLCVNEIGTLASKIDLIDIALAKESDDEQREQQLEDTQT